MMIKNLNHLRVALAAAGIMAAVGLLMVVYAQPAEAAFPGRNGKIAFSSNRDGGNYEIYTMNANGTGLDRLTNDPKGDTEPAWSPDGSRIAFVSTCDGNQEIYTMNPSGMSLDRLTNNTQSDIMPDWQPLSRSQKMKYSEFQWT